MKLSECIADTDRDKDSAAAVKRFFDGMGWPEPTLGDEDGNDCYSATGSRRIVFITSLGLVINITPKRSLKSMENPHFLMPLFSRAAGEYQIDINPGYEHSQGYHEAEHAYARIRNKFGVTISDAHNNNVCFVPQTEPRYPVLIDIDLLHIDRLSLAQLSKAVRSVIPFLPNLPPYDNPQDHIYDPLRKIIKDAWPANTDTPDPKGIEAFKEACTDFKAEGRLVAAWDDDSTPSFVTKYAKSYAQKLEAC